MREVAKSKGSSEVFATAAWESSVRLNALAESTGAMLE